MTFQFQVSKVTYHIILGPFRVFRFPRARFLARQELCKHLRKPGQLLGLGMYLTRRKALLIGCWFSIWSITLGCIGIDGDGIATTVRLMKHEAATIKSSSQSIRHGCHTFTVASVGFSNG